MNTRANRLAVAILALLGALPGTVHAQAKYVAGEHYTELPRPAPTRSGERIEVVEFFLYACPHCYHFEPRVRPWAENLPEDVSFRQVPATFGRPGPIHARLFYTALELGVLDEIHADVFAAIHEQKRPLVRRPAIRAFFVERGVEGAAFDQAFDSPAVAAKVDEATALMQAHRVASVPSLGVNGRYWIGGRQAGSNPAMLEVAEFLIRRERAR